MPLANQIFGCYGNITRCCKSYHKATVKFSSNPRISFSRKSTRKDHPPAKSDQNKAISHFCPRAMGILPPPKYPRVVKQPPEKLTFSTTSVLLLLDVPLSLSRGTIFRRQKNPRRGYRPKIAGILFVYNEPGRSIPYCAHILNRTNMDARASCSTSREVGLAPSGDYVLLVPSGDYKQTILGVTFSRTLL